MLLDDLNSSCAFLIFVTNTLWSLPPSDPKTAIWRRTWPSSLALPNLLYHSFTHTPFHSDTVTHNQCVNVGSFCFSRSMPTEGTSLDHSISTSSTSPSAILDAWGCCCCGCATARLATLSHLNLFILVFKLLWYAWQHAVAYSPNEIVLSLRASSKCSTLSAVGVGAPRFGLFLISHFQNHDSSFYFKVT